MEEYSFQNIFWQFSTAALRAFFNYTFLLWLSTFFDNFPLRLSSTESNTKAPELDCKKVCLKIWFISLGLSKKRVGNYHLASTSLLCLQVRCQVCKLVFSMRDLLGIHSYCWYSRVNGCLFQGFTYQVEHYCELTVILNEC